MSFRGVGGGECRGIVDVLAIRKNTARPNGRLLKSGDLFDIILVQMKGGSARRPSASELRRLLVVERHYGAKNIVLFAWKRKKGCQFSVLDHGKWSLSTALRIFG